MKETRTVPAGIRREVRRRSGFGCVICGIPIIQYDHIIEWSKVRRHQSANITALCPTHHDDKTHGRLPLQVLLEANKNPRNRSSKPAEAYGLFYGSRPIQVRFGSVSIVSTQIERFIPLVVDGMELVSWRVEDGVYLLSAQWHDDEGRVLFQIVDNELTINAASWDVEFVSNRLTIRSGFGQIKLVVKFDPPSLVTFLAGAFSRGGHDVQIKKDSLTIDGTEMSNLKLSEGGIGIAVGGHAPGLNAIIHFE
jgi:hypothetical protein